MTLDEKEFRIRDISSQIVAIFEKQATENGIDLRIHWEGSDSNPLSNAGMLDHGPNGTGRVKDMILWGDQHRILQVVINLISNSLKFTPKGGSVTLTIRCTGEMEEAHRLSLISSRANSARGSMGAHRYSDTSVAPGRFDTANEINVMNKSLTPSRTQSNDRVSIPPMGKNLCFEFEVEDTGPGIAKAQQQRIFEPFVQADLGLSKKYGGTGLGLSICQQLAGLMRGTITLTSEEGKGSMFRMQIPLRHLKNRADSTASSSFTNLPGSHRSSFSEPRPGTALEEPIQSAPIPSPGGPSKEGALEFPDSKPRLVGLSTPFFASNTPLESPGSQMKAMERIKAQAEKEGQKVKVLVAEDNKTNQEVVHRMLNLEDVYDVTIAQGKAPSRVPISSHD